MNQAITKMAAVQKGGGGRKKKREEGKKRGFFSLCVVLPLSRARVASPNGFRKVRALKDEVGCVCFLHLQTTSNVIVI